MEPKSEEARPEVLNAMPTNVQALFKAQAQSKFGAQEPSNKEVLKDPNVQNAFLQRKQDSFNQLKKWDDKRTLFVNTHRNLLESILLKLDKKIRISSQSLTGVVQFFKDRILQENEYIKFLSTKLNKLSGLFRDNEQQNTNIELYPGLTKAFCELDDFHVKKAKNLTDFVKFLETNVMKDVLVKDSNEFEKKVSQFKERIIALKKNLSSLNVEAIQKSSKYSKLYQEMLQDQTGKFKSEKKDLYMYEMAFVKAALEQNSGSKKLAKEVLDLWQECLKSEVSRIDSVRRSFQLYLAKINEVFGKSTLVDIPLKILEILDPIKEAENQFMITKILSQEELNFIKKTIDKNDITFKELKVFFEEFEIKDMPQKPLVKKEISVLRDVGGITKNFKECLFIVTIDNNLLILDNPEKEEVNESTHCLNIDSLTLTAKKDATLYDLVEKVPGFLFDSTNKFLIKVPNEDKLDELMHYLNLKK